MGKNLRRVRIASLPALAALAGILLAWTGPASASSKVSVSPRDDCGGSNDWVQWTGSSLHVWGQVWDTHCSGGTTELWVSWNGAVHNNLEAGSAVDPNTAGVNFERSTDVTPTDIIVTVCSTKGGWHCGPGVNVNTASGGTTTTTVTTTAPPTTTVVTAPVPTPVPRPRKHSRVLRARLELSWTWDRGTTWLRRVKLGRVPDRAQITVRCSGRGCASPVHGRAAGARHVRKLLGRLVGRRYRAGDRLLLTLTAPGWKPERVRVTIRTSRLPQIRLLRD
jgi:hypothetical protein